MPELTAEQIEKAQTMTLDELRAMAIKEAAEPVAAPVGAAAQPRDKDGKFAARDTGKDEFDNSADEEEEEEDDGTPSRTIYRKEIDNADGSGVDVYEADSLEELVEKIAAGKANANKKIRELNQVVKAATAKTQQISEDDDFVVSEKLKKNPKQTVKEIAAEVLREQQEAVQKALRAQEQFVATHPDYVANPENAGRLTAWLQSHGYSECTTEGLEKAYQDLKASGLLVLKIEEADGATDEEAEVTERTVQPKAEATQQRSQKKASTISTTRTRAAAANRVQQPSVDEAYAMPMEKLRDLANAQLATANRQE